MGSREAPCRLWLFPTTLLHFTVFPRSRLRLRKEKGAHPASSKTGFWSSWNTSLVESRVCICLWILLDRSILEGGWSRGLAAPVFLAELCCGLTPTLPLLLWVLVGTPWVLLNFLIFLYETLKGNFFKMFPKNLLEWNFSFPLRFLVTCLFLKLYKACVVDRGWRTPARSCARRCPWSVSGSTCLLKKALSIRNS